MSTTIRNGLAVLAIVALTAMSAKAIDINSTVADWTSAGLFRTDVLPAATGGLADMIGWGVTVQNGRLYTIIQSATPMNSTDMWFGGAWLDADRSEARQLNPRTELAGFDPSICMFTGVYRGSDLYWEYSPTPYSAGGSDQDGHNYWGKNHVNYPADMAFSTLPISGGQTAVRTESEIVEGVEYQRGVVVQSISLSDLKANLATANTNIPESYSFGYPTTAGCAELGVLDGQIDVGVRLSRHMWANGWGDGGGCIGGSIVEEVQVPFMVTLQALAGDADWSGATNATDLNTVLSYYNQSGTNWAQGNFDGLSGTNATDLNTVLSYYNQSLSGGAVGGLQMASVNTSTVPEPSTIVMLATLSALLGAWVIRRR